MTGPGESRIYSGVVKALIVGYPILGLVYLTDRLGTLVEPIFFVAFSVMVLTEVFEPKRRTMASPDLGGSGRGPWPASHGIGPGLADVGHSAGRRRGSGRPGPGARPVPGVAAARTSGRGRRRRARRLENDRLQRGPPFAPRVMGSSTQSRGPVHVGLHNGSPRYRA